MNPGEPGGEAPQIALVEAEIAELRAQLERAEKERERLEARLRPLRSKPSHRSS